MNIGLYKKIYSEYMHKCANYDWRLSSRLATCSTAVKDLGIRLIQTLVRAPARTRLVCILGAVPGIMLEKNVIVLVAYLRRGK